MAALDGAAGIGVLLYVFVTGLHLDVGALRADARRLGGIALGSVVVPLLLGLGAGAWILAQAPGVLGPAGDRLLFLAAVAICVAVTALPVLAAVLQEAGMLGTRLGQTGLALAALNDLALWLMLAILLAVSGSHGGPQALAMLTAAVAWGCTLVFAIRPLLTRLAGSDGQTALVVGVALALLSASLSEALGTGYLIGAFLAGLVMPPACRPALLARLEMVTATVLLPFFFMSTGLKAFMQPGSAGFWALLAVTTGATIIGKVAGTALPARALGFAWRDALSLGAMMQTKGLMEVVVLAVLNDAGLIGRDIFSAMVAMAVLCTVATAPAIRLIQSYGAVRPGAAAAPDLRR